MVLAVCHGAYSVVWCVLCIQAFTLWPGVYPVLPSILCGMFSIVWCCSYRTTQYVVCGAVYAVLYGVIFVTLLALCIMICNQWYDVVCAVLHYVGLYMWCGLINVAVCLLRVACLGIHGMVLLCFLTKSCTKRMRYMPV